MNVESYIDYQRNRLSANTREAYLRDISQFEAYLQTAKIASWDLVTPDVIEEFLEYGFTTKRTANRKLSSIRSLFRYLVKKKVLETNPSLVAEGYGRKTTLDYIRMLYISYGSVCKLETQILLAGDLDLVYWVNGKKT